MNKKLVINIGFDIMKVGYFSCLLYLKMNVFTAQRHSREGGNPEKDNINN